MIKSRSWGGSWRDLKEEIRQAVLELGQLSKDEIVATWGLSEIDYRQIHAELSNTREIRSGARRIGGLERRESGRGRDNDPPPPNPPAFELADWERATADRLVDLLDFKALESLLGNLRHSLREARKAETGEDRRGSKEEFATALVVQHGMDLFVNGDIREAVAKALRTKNPGRWHPGKAAASEFVARVGFPSLLAGLPVGEGEPDFEYFEARFRLEPLQPFQKEVQRGLLETLQDPLGRRCIVTLPTGGGKTRVAVESLAYWFADRFDRDKKKANRGVVLWLAHTEELCEQAAACFRQVWQATDNVTPLTLIRFWGGYTRDLLEHEAPLQSAMGSATALISTPQRISNMADGRVAGGEAFLSRLDGSLGLILIDEAHRAAAPMYRRILSRWSAQESRPSLVGLTATPFRMEYAQSDPEAGTRELIEIFERLVEPRLLGTNPRLTLQAMQILAEPVFEEILTDTSMRLPQELTGDSLSEESIEKIDQVLALRADNTKRRFVALGRLRELCQNPEHSILYFGPSVHDAECVAFLLLQSGVRAAVISGATRDGTRRQTIQRFKKGEIQVLCNCEVLTTGFDAPRVSHVVVARPTVSQVLYEQMVGRGLRGPKFGGTAKCGVVNLRDQYRGAMPQLGFERFRDLWYGIGSEELEKYRATDVVGRPLESPLPRSMAAPPIPNREGSMEKGAWPELWEELLRWREGRGDTERWEREVLERMAHYLRNGWPIDTKTRGEADKIRIAAQQSGFIERAIRRPQEELFSIGN